MRDETSSDRRIFAIIFRCDKIGSRIPVADFVTTGFMTGESRERRARSCSHVMKKQLSLSFVRAVAAAEIGHGGFLFIRRSGDRSFPLRSA